MSLIDAAESLDDLANERPPSSKRVLLGLTALDTKLLRAGVDPALHDAAAVLELFVATGGVISGRAEDRARYAHLAVVIRAIVDE